MFKANRFRILSLVPAVGLAFGVSAQPGLIDFELTPGGVVPVDNATLDRNTPYIADGVGVTFGWDTDLNGITDTNARFERRGSGGGGEGFISSQGTGNFDTERSGSAESLGDYFLRAPGSIAPIPGNFVIEYDTPVSALSGQIWDIDTANAAAYEQWRVTAFDAAGLSLGLIDSPIGLLNSDPAGLDSLAWTFAFSGIGAISRVEISFIGTTQSIGFAFNDYNAIAVPAPASAAALSAIALGFFRRQRH